MVFVVQNANCSRKKQPTKLVMVGYRINNLELIKALKLTPAFIWEMRNYLDANGCFLTISFEFGPISRNFYSTANLVFLSIFSDSSCTDECWRCTGPMVTGLWLS